MLDDDRPYSVKQLAERWNCSRQFVHKLIRKGDLKAFWLGDKLLRVPAEEVRRWVERLGPTDHHDALGRITRDVSEATGPR